MRVALPPGVAGARGGKVLTFASLSIIAYLIYEVFSTCVILARLIFLCFFDKIKKVF
jgi:hypothetical protein